MSKDQGLPKRLMNPMWRSRNYIELKAGMPDPAKDARIAREKTAETATIVTKADTILSPVPAVTSDFKFIKAWTWSAVASTSQDSVFSSSYENYFLIIENIDTGQDLYFRVRAAGTDAASAVYYTGHQGVDTASTQDWQGIAATTNGILVQKAEGSYLDGAMSVWIYRPFIADITFTRSMSYAKYTSGGWLGNAGGYHDLSSSYDGFTLRLAAGTMSGRGKLYGLTG